MDSSAGSGRRNHGSSPTNPSEISVRCIWRKHRRSGTAYHSYALGNRMEAVEAIETSAGWDENRKEESRGSCVGDRDHGTCTLSLSISRPYALSPIKRPRKHGQNRPNRVGPHRQLLFLQPSSYLFLSLSVSDIDYSSSAGSVYQSPRSYSSAFPLVYRLLWASLLPSVGPNPKSHIILSTTVRRPGHIISVLQALLHPSATYVWSTYRICPFQGEIDLIQPRVAPFRT